MPSAGTQDRPGILVLIPELEVRSLSDTAAASASTCRNWPLVARALGARHRSVTEIAASSEARVVEGRVCEFSSQCDPALKLIIYTPVWRTASATHAGAAARLEQRD
jgi:hypothetical protein